jgi:quinoprotein relay system zinc metallohydrolase 2
MQIADRRRGTILFMLLASATNARAAADGFNLEQPVAGVFVHLGRQLALNVQGHDDIANIGFVVGEKCVAVIDTGGSTSVGRALLAAIKKHTALPVCYVINTHVHVDHILGNLAFKSDRVSFIGSDALPAAVARSTDFFVKEYGGDMDSPPSAAQVVAPDRLVASELTLDLGGRKLLLRAWPKAHTDCDLTVFDTRTATLWTGDLLFRERLPALDGSAKGWLSVIDSLSRMHVALAIPGHGGIGLDFKRDLDAERGYLQALVEGVRAELAQALPVEDAIAHSANAEKPRWLLWDSTHPHNVSRVYEELEWE